MKCCVSASTPENWIGKRGWIMLHGNIFTQVNQKRNFDESISTKLYYSVQMSFLEFLQCANPFLLALSSYIRIVIFGRKVYLSNEESLNYLPYSIFRHWSSPSKQVAHSNLKYTSRDVSRTESFEKWKTLFKYNENVFF